MKKIITVISLFVIVCLNLSSCGPIEPGIRLSPHTDTIAHKKWLALVESLKLPEDPSHPSEYLTNKDHHIEYKNLVIDIANRFNSKAFATRCASIERFRSIEELNTPNSTFNVYQFSYKLQKNYSGEAEDHPRHGLVTIPKDPTKTYPLLAYAHEGDKGLSLNMLSRNLKSLLDEYIVIAPAFPEESLVDIKQELKSSGISSPWDNDADDLLGMHDCIARDIYLNLEKKKNPILAKELANHISKEHSEEIEHQLGFIRDHAVTYGGTIANYPKSVLAGASRGGLVASVAMAKAGSSLVYIKKKNPALFLRLYLTKGHLDEKFVTYLRGEESGENMGLGYKFGGIPSFFSGIATVSAPATVTIGRFRIILEQMIKGNLHLTRAKLLPAINQLESKFANYLNGGDINQAKFEIISRDFSFITPLILAGLKDWSSFTNKGGSFLFLHGKEDKVVPIEQSMAAHEIFQTMLENEMVKNTTFSSNGVQVFYRTFSNIEQTDESTQFHFDDPFFNSHSFYHSHPLTEKGSAFNIKSEHSHLLSRVMSQISDKISKNEVIKPNEDCPMFKQLTVNYIINNGGFRNFSEDLNSNVDLKLHTGTEELKLQEGQGPAEVLEKWGLLMKQGLKEKKNSIL